MSKSKPKDKKGQAQNPFEKELQDKKRQLLDATFTIRKLQERLDRLIIDNKDLNERFDQMRQNNLREIDKLKTTVDSKEEQNKALIVKMSSIEIEKMKKEMQVTQLQSNYNSMLDQKNKEIEQLRQNSTSDIKSLENKLKQFEIFMAEKDQLEKDRAELRHMLQFQKAERIRELADKERQRVQATDKLKNDMLHKIQQTKTNLLSLKKDQLSTTTRLTVLQNHQLTSQLEYQSKQTQKLLFKNEELQNKVTNLQRDLEIHKQVEQELAKRSHFSRGIIKKLTQQIKQLEEAAEKKKEQTEKLKTSSQNEQPIAVGQSRRGEVIGALEANLDELEKKYARLQNDHDLLKNQNNYLQTRLEEHESKIEKIGGLLVRYLDEILEGKHEVKDDSFSYDLRTLRKADVKQWHRDEVSLVVTLLLNLIKPLLTKKNVNLVVPPMKKTLYFQDDQQNGDNSSTNLPKISQDPESAQGERRTQIKRRLHDMPINVATKIVGSSLRQWGRTVSNSSSSINLARKYKVGDSLK